MSVVKVIELLAESPQSWEEATQNALKGVLKSVRNVKSIYVSDFQATVENDRIANYRVNVKVSFIVEQ